MKKPFYGLDFGTSNSVISIADGATARIISVDQKAPRENVLQSIEYFRENGEQTVGQAAIDNYLADNAARRPVQWEEIDTGEEKKVEIVGYEGINYYTTTIKVRVDVNKPGQMVQALKTTLREGSLSTAVIFDKQYSLEKLIAHLLGKMKAEGDRIVGQDITSVVLGRPVHYIEAGQDDVHVEKRMEEAARMAGFTDISFMPEPIAAALSYLAADKAAKKILIFDFGGGTLDFSVVERNVGAQPHVIGTGGLPIGGDVFNEEIMVKILAPYFGSEEMWGPKQLPMPAFLKYSLRRWYELDQLQTREIRDFLAEVRRTADRRQYILNLEELINYDLGYRLFRHIEEAKKTLSSEDVTHISFHREQLKLDVAITRDEFESILDPYEVQIDRALDSLLNDVDLEPSELDHIVATGGSSLIPKFQRLLEDKFGKEKIWYHDIFTGVGAGLALADRLS